MQSNIRPQGLSRPKNYLLALLVIAGIYSYISEQSNKPSTNINANVQTEQKPSEIRFEDFLSTMQQEQQLEIEEYSTNNENDVAISNLIKEENEAKMLQKKTEYIQLIADFNKADDTDKVLLLQKIWKLAPEVGIEDNLLTILQLATHDPDSHIEKLSRKILNDLQRFKDGTLRQEEQLVSQIIEINNYQKKLTESSDNNTPETVDQLKSNNSTTDFEMTQQKSEKIDQLTKLALTSENIETKKYALANLVQLDHVSALNVIEHQLLNSKSSDERFRAIENLRSSIGNFDSNKIREILEMANDDYDTTISENASNTLEILDNYTYAQNNPVASDIIAPEFTLPEQP